MTYTLFVKRRAYVDIDGMFESVRRRVGRARASRWRDGLLARLTTLEQHPEMWPLADEAADLGLDLRELLYGRRRNVYRILFTVDGQTVNVHRVRHAAQDRLSAGDV